MKYTNEQLKKIYFGAYRFTEDADGWLKAYQYTAEQMEYLRGVADFFYERSDASTAKTLEFTTTATQVSFDYNIVWKGSEDTFELYVDGLADKLVYVKDIPDTGRLSFELPEGEKAVIIYLPTDATVLIRGFEIDAPAVPAKKSEKVLWLGDSITQGFGPLRSGCTYVSAANRLLDYDIVNQGIGGYVYDAKVLMPMPGYEPDKLIVALGTNQYGEPTMENVEKYYERLVSLYPDKPILCITPLWRYDNPEGVPTLIRFCKGIAEVASRYENVTVVDGFRLVPHLPEYYLDNLHPNCLGAEIYARNLVAAIERVGF